MRKSVLTLAMLAIFGLAACTSTPTSSSSPSSSTSSPSEDSSYSSTNPDSSVVPDSSSSVIETPNWTSEEQETIASLFEDHEIPFYDWSSHGLTYQIMKDTTDNLLYLFVENVSSTILNDFVTFMTTDTVFEDVSSDYTSTYGEGFHVIEGTYPDTSFVRATACLFDSTSYEMINGEGTGTFQAVFYPVAIASATWPGEEIKALIYSLIGITTDLPTPTTAAEKYMTYSAYDSSYNEYPILDFIGIDATTSYVNDLKNAGWSEIAGVVEGGKYYASSDTTLGVLVYLSSEDPLVTCFQFMENDYYLTYPETVVNSISDTIAGTSEHGNLPVPTGLDNCEFILITDYSEYGYAYVDFYGVDIEESYIKQLTDANWKAASYDGSDYLYTDPNNALLVRVRYLEEYGETEIYISENEGNYAGWPSDVVSTAITALGGKTTLPTPDFTVEFTMVYDYIESSQRWEIDIMNMDTATSYADLTDEYKALLNASDSGWTYDELQGLWHDAENTLAVNVGYSSYGGTEITVEKYHPISETWPSSDITDGLASLGISDITIPEVTGSSGYMYLEKTGSIQIDAYGVTSEEYNAYLTSLTTAGYNHGIVSDTYSTEIYYWDADQKVCLSFDYNEESSILSITIYPFGSILDNIKSEVTNINASMASIDSEFTIPAIPCSDTAVGVVTSSSFWGYTSVLFSIFETGFASAYETVLVNAGWTKDTTSTTTTYTLSTTTNDWKVTITESSTNNCTTITFTNY